MSFRSLVPGGFTVASFMRLVLATAGSFAFVLATVPALGQDAQAATASAATATNAKSDGNTDTADVTGEAEAPDEEALSEEEAAAVRARAEQLAAMTEEVKRIESELGPYDPGLIELLSDKGRLHTEAGQFGEAAEAYGRALQLVRVSDGLYSGRQIAILDNLIASNKAAENWAEVDNNHHLLFLIQSRLYEPGDPAYTAAVLRQGEWKLDAARAGLLRQSLNEQLRNMEDVRSLYADTAEQMVAFERGDPVVRDLSDPDGLVSLLHGKARTEYVIGRYLMQIPPEYFDAPVARYVDRVVCYSGLDQETPRFLPAAYDAEQRSRQGLAQAAPAPAPAPRGPVCVSQRVANPNYRAAQYSEHRNRVERASMDMRDTVEQLQWLLDNGQLGVEEIAEQQKRVDDLRQLYDDLRNDARRRSFRWGF